MLVTQHQRAMQCHFRAPFESHDHLVRQRNELKLYSQDLRTIRSCHHQLFHEERDTINRKVLKTQVSFESCFMSDSDRFCSAWCVIRRRYFLCFGVIDVPIISRCYETLKFLVDFFFHTHEEKFYLLQEVAADLLAIWKNNGMLLFEEEFLDVIYA